MMFNLLPDDNHAHSSQTPLSLSVALMVMMSDPGSRLRQLHSTKQCEKLIVHGPVPKVLEDIRVMTPRTAAEQHKRLMDLEWRLTALESDELQKMWKVVLSLVFVVAPYPCPLCLQPGWRACSCVA
eukprot:3860760-Rhodomonas_salina.3